ncbi:MAG: hypothetical protein QW227_00580 [Candidatus Aenigmatarchaeota archaeon]
MVRMRGMDAHFMVRQNTLHMMKTVNATEYGPSFLRTTRNLMDGSKLMKAATLSVLEMVLLLEKNKNGLLDKNNKILFGFHYI